MLFCHVVEWNCPFLGSLRSVLSSSTCDGKTSVSLASRCGSYQGLVQSTSLYLRLCLACLPLSWIVFFVLENCYVQIWVLVARGIIILTQTSNILSSFSALGGSKLVLFPFHIHTVDTHNTFIKFFSTYSLIYTLSSSQEKTMMSSFLCLLNYSTHVL